MPKSRLQVHRYTVDNRYGDAVVTLVVARLTRGRTAFTDAPEDWEDEEWLIERPAELLERLAVPGGGPVDADLQPGRVFLRGRFEVVGPTEAPTGFEVAEDLPENWLRIDRLPLVKHTVNRLYSNLLTARGSRDG